VLRVALLVASHAVAIPAPVQAQGERVVVSRASPRDIELGRAAAGALAERLSSRGALARVPIAPDRLEPLAPELDRATAAYANLDPSGAATQLDGVLRVVSDAGGAGLSRPELLRALLLRAMAGLATGDAETAGVALDRALAIDPELSPDPAEYPPTLRDALEARRPAADRHTLVLRGPLGASGLSIDAAEARGREHVLAPGVHLLRVETPAHEPWTAEIDLRSDVVLEIDPRFAPEAALAAPEAGRADVERASRMLDVGIVYLHVARDGGGWSLRAEDGAAGRTVRAAIGTRDELPRAAAELARGLLATPRTRAPRERAGGRRDDEAASPWPWIAAGGAVVLTAAGILAVVLASPDQEGGRWSR
jgi:hypothetical protein